MLVNPPPKIPPRLLNLGALPFYHLPARGLGAEMQLMKALVQIDSTELVCLMWGGRDGCWRVWGEKGSFPAAFEACWPWHLVGARLAGGSCVSLCSHLCFLSLCCVPPLLSLH